MKRRPNRPKCYSLYTYGKVWIPKGNPIRLEQGYYHGYELNDYLEKLPAEEVKAYHEFMEQG